MVLNKSWVVSFDWQSLCAPPPPSQSQWWLNGVNRRDRVLTPLSGQNLRPITFSVCSNCGSSVDFVGGKGKVKAKSKGLASIHLTEWVKGNKWLSFDQLYIHLFSVTSVKDTGAYLCCTRALIKWKQKKKRFFSSLGSLINEKLSICGRHHHASTSPPVVIIIAGNNAWETVADVWTMRAVKSVEKCEIPPHAHSVPTHLAISSWRIF